MLYYLSLLFLSYSVLNLSLPSLTSLLSLSLLRSPLSSSLFLLLSLSRPTFHFSRSLSLFGLCRECCLSRLLNIQRKLQKLPYNFLMERMNFKHYLLSRERDQLIWVSTFSAFRSDSGFSELGNFLFKSRTLRATHATFRTEKRTKLFLNS